jgi:hypothetical protein
MNNCFWRFVKLSNSFIAPAFIAHTEAKSIFSRIQNQNIKTSVADPDKFWPDPEPTFENVRIRILPLINFRPNSFKNFFWWKYALKTIFMNQKVKQPRFLKYLWLLNILTKLRYGHLLGPGSGSGPRRPDPDPTKKVRIRPDPDPQHW